MARGGQVRAMSIFSEELRRARGRAGMTQDQLAEKIAYSSSLVAHVEAGTRAPSADFSHRVDEALNTGGLLTRLHPLVRGEAYPSWFRDWIEIEREAASFRWFEPLLVPGLLQTREYARAVLEAANPGSCEELISELVSNRMERQSVLNRPEPPMLWVIIDEHVLMRPVGGAATMRDQIDRLIEASRQPKIMLQVVPDAAGAHPGLDGHFVIASFDGAPDVVYLNNALSGQVVEPAADVSRVTLLFDILKAEALAPRASIELMRKALSTWT